MIIILFLSLVFSLPQQDDLFETTALAVTNNHHMHPHYDEESNTLDRHIFQDADVLDLDFLNDIQSLENDPVLNSGSRVKTGRKRRNKAFERKRDILRSDLASYLGTKLAKRLQIQGKIRIPWWKMTRNDIINWPESVKFIVLRKIDMKGLKILSELAKNDKLDFSPNFLLQLQKKWTDR